MIEQISKKILLDIPYHSYERLFDIHKDSFINTKYYANIEKRTDNKNIMAYIIRCNDYYITNDMKRNNDYLVVIWYDANSVIKYCFGVTADPKTRKKGIANIIEQVYFGNIRNHWWTLGRDAICQDNCDVWVRRYTLLTDYYEEKGRFHINIHNNAGAFNSSLGCTIFADDSEYFNHFRPLLRNCTNKNYVPVSVISEKNFLEIINSL